MQGTFENFRIAVRGLPDARQSDKFDGMTRDEEGAPAGSCASHPDPDMWFADGLQWERKAEAVRICNSCPLLGPCREMALREWPLLAGGVPLYAVVGGLTEKDIRRVRRGLEPVGVRPPGRPRGAAGAPPDGTPCVNGHENPARDARGRCRKCNSEASARSAAERRAKKAVC